MDPRGGGGKLLVTYGKYEATVADLSAKDVELAPSIQALTDSDTAFAGNRGRTKYTTMKPYLTGLQSYCVDMSMDDLDVFRYFRVRRVIRGIKIFYGTRDRSKGQLTMPTAASSSHSLHPKQILSGWELPSPPPATLHALSITPHLREVPAANLQSPNAYLSRSTPDYRSTFARYNIDLTLNGH
ncbi:hypothetical protein FN846DRAFT_909721 [Sphaerosporella brunnea]|uniref:Uncharacterized protein n=1 Tax=Sphaerosporella brunnea TaxID=1250544 RepID=A0A5J5EQ98_9PEZI|nr:hypothetical protein FN846DRAFT_909721 [Sphaerosporella brunnea]